MNSFKKHLYETFLLAIPIIIGQLGIVLMGVVDSAMVGKVGAKYLAAASIGSGIFALFLVLGIGISYAISPLVSISIAAGKKEFTSFIFKQSFYINLVVGIILCIVTIFVADFIKYFNQEKEVEALAISYTKILGLSIIPVMIFQSFKQFIEGLSIMRPAMIVALVANVVNVFVNWVLIYGELGFPELRLDGAGIATFISRLFMAVALGYFVFTSKSLKSFNLSIRSYRYDSVITNKILKLGVPSGVQYFFEVGCFTFAAVIIGWLGTNQLAAHQIALSAATISYMTVLGVSSAAAIRVGSEVGRQNIYETRIAAFSAIALGIIIQIIFALFFILFRNIIPTFYVFEIEVIKIAASLFIIAGLFQIFDGIQAIGLGVLRGLTDVKIPTAITFTAYWLIGLPIGYFLGFNLELDVIGVWLGLLIGLATSATLLSIRINIKSKRNILLPFEDKSSHL